MISPILPVSVASTRSARLPLSPSRFGNAKGKGPEAPDGLPELEALLRKVLIANRKNEGHLNTIYKAVQDKISHTQQMIALQKIPTCLRQAHHLVPDMATETVSAEKITQFVNQMAKGFAKTNDIGKQKAYLQAASLAVLRYAQKQSQINLYDEGLMPIVHSHFVRQLQPLTQPLKAPWPWQKDKIKWHDRANELPDFAAERPWQVNNPADYKEWANLALSTWKNVFQQVGAQKSATFLRDFDVNKCLKDADGILLICEEPKKWTKYKV